MYIVMNMRIGWNDRLLRVQSSGQTGHADNNKASDVIAAVIIDTITHNVVIRPLIVTAISHYINTVNLDIGCDLM